ncbi:MAG TPA: Rrf2 family transcriptional regulator [Candidatus Dormibacteraeota bacterium]|nr:Rrf2 family transcriptional regulator [Candidatus Dormibacteraeota bacterium]
MTVGMGRPSPFSMRVSSRAHYGLRMMTEFAKAYPAGRPLSLSEVARVEGLPLAYLEQLAGQLRRGGLVDATRGAHGGYMLARPPLEISVLDVVTLVDGEVAPVECVAHAYEPGSCVREGDCASRALWQRLKTSIDMVLSTTSLAELVTDHSLVDALAPAAAATCDDDGVDAGSCLEPADPSIRLEVAHAR